MGDDKCLYKEGGKERGRGERGGREERRKEVGPGGLTSPGSPGTPSPTLSLSLPHSSLESLTGLPELPASLPSSHQSQLKIPLSLSCVQHP